MKKCSQCNETKSMDDFGTFKRSRDGKQAWCRPCMKQALADRYKRIASQEPQKGHTSKFCLECKRDLPLSQFGVRKASLDHLNQYCKPCWRVRVYTSKRKHQNGR